MSRKGENKKIRRKNKEEEKNNEKTTETFVRLLAGRKKIPTPVGSSERKVMDHSKIIVIDLFAEEYF